MDGYDPERRIGLVVDEWGTWHPAEPGRNSRLLWQQNTLRDGLVAALTLDIFNRHADKVVMANIAQTINVLQSMILTEEEKMIKTPTFHAYEMYSPHQDAKALRTSFEADSISFGEGKNQIFGLAGSASLKKDELFLTVVNPHVDTAVEATIELYGGKAVEGKARIMTHEDIHAHNTFDAPDTVAPKDETFSADGSELHYTFQPASVTAISLKIA